MTKLTPGMLACDQCGKLTRRRVDDRPACFDCVPAIAGEILMFSEKGLALWLEGRRGFFEAERYRKWRWRVLGLSEDVDRDGKPLLILERCDIKPYTRREKWSRLYFEVSV